MNEEKFDEYKIDFSDDGMKNSYIKRVPTGFKRLDKLIQGGLAPELIVLGAISSLGKSTFALQMAQMISSQKINGENIPVIYFSLEMSKQSISLKMSSRTAFEMVREKTDDYQTCREMALSSAELTDGSGLSFEKAKLRKAALEKCTADTSSLYIIERDVRHKSFSAETIAGIVGAFMRSHPGAKPVVFVDYLQILTAANVYSTKNERQIVDENIARLWLLAKEQNIPVFVISSVNRDSYNKPISFAAFKESGAIEFTADVVLGMQFSAVSELDKKQLKEFSADREKRNDPRRLQVIVLKQRYGRCGDDVYSSYNYYPAYSCFEEIDNPPVERSNSSGGSKISYSRYTQERKSGVTVL